ncbi:MAG: DedA family protein [Firmicutes bacterium]|nr:DedA family protein [Bacillota bacterium]
MQALSAFLEHAIRHYGILAVFLAMVLESACIPLPSELIMTYAGFEAFRGNIAFAPAVVAGIVGNVVGAMIAYYVGSRGGRVFLQRYGKYIFFSEKHFAAAERYFVRYGTVTTLVSRVLPVLRTFISLPAGIARMDRRRFLLYTTIGSIPWVYVLTYLGYKLGQNWTSISAHFTALTVIFVVIFVAAVIWFWTSARARKV